MDFKQIFKVNLNNYFDQVYFDMFSLGIIKKFIYQKHNIFQLNKEFFLKLQQHLDNRNQKVKMIEEMKFQYQFNTILFIIFVNLLSLIV